MSRYFTKEENEIIFQSYVKGGYRKTVDIVNKLSPETINLKINNIKIKIRRIVSYYNKGMQDLLVDGKRGINRKPDSGRPLKNFVIFLNQIEMNLKFKSWRK
ncbi:hypothetical protein [Mycoplasma phocimorsus]|uniref:hypothetical protein n=1 Tax=Mycoplasma phocimorsus TaxID=3045839 RepID=UPI0024BFB1DB|nr:hypothetical protein [Mycoplasma phocimorsus]MDJ1646658.1 hypothetical protein [Mycoplasma phocimorsus]